jgi:hypothetical protein
MVNSGTWNRIGVREFFICLVLLMLGGWPFPASAEEVNPRGQWPVYDATYFPELGGLRNEAYYNQYGQERKLSECLVLRESTVKDGNVTVPAGSLFYAAETSYDARPLMRDPFLILGEHAYLVRSTHHKVVKTDVHVKKRGRALLDPSGYRLWYDYATDHYEKPYGEFALISPSGAWPHEWPLSTSFPEPETVKNMKLQEGLQPQQKNFFMGSTYIYGSTVLVAKGIGFNEAVFSTVEYPAISEAIFSMERPYTCNIRQESYRWYGTKRIYAFRKENGVLVEVRDWTGKKVLASKLLVPSTQQEYHIEDQEKMCLTRLDLDLHIELIVEPSWKRYSDFSPWTTGVPYGWENGTVACAIYNDLVKVEDGKPWPRDERYIVRLEPDLETGMLKRLVLENREPIVFNAQHSTYTGPIKISEVWDRPYFRVVVNKIDKGYVKNCYVRDSYFQRTDNMILWEAGRNNIDFIVGMSPLVKPIMEDTFLTRLADPTYGVPVVKSRFTSYPEVIPNAKWFAPDDTCAFVPKMKGFVRKYVTNRKGYRLTASDALIIKASYVDYRNQKIIIPPGGMCYSSRDSRNIRPGESFVILGKDAYLERFKSYMVVRKNFRIDRWKEYPMGDGNLLYWQDVPLGDGSKAMRYTGTKIFWGRPVAELRVTKYSGNDWGANILLAPGFYSYDDVDKTKFTPGVFPADNEYHLPQVFGEGGTYVIPKWVAPDFVEIAEMGTPGMNEFTITFKKPERVVLKVGQTVPVGDHTLKLAAINRAAKTVNLVLSDTAGKVVAQKSLGPLTQELYDLLPQYGPSQEKLNLVYQDFQVDLDYPVDLSKDEIPMYVATGCETFKRDEPWPRDPRFLVRPDVCGHCYQLNEFILDNKDPIILDEKNPVVEGPEGYFKIVIDDFDGESINAWHIEDREGKRTPNLAEYARQNVDVMVGVNGTVESFLRKTVIDRLAYREHWRLSGE